MLGVRCGGARDPPHALNLVALMSCLLSEQLRPTVDYGCRRGSFAYGRILKSFTGTCARSERRGH